MDREPIYEVEMKHITGVWESYPFWDGGYTFRATDLRDLEDKSHSLEVNGWTIVGLPERVLEWGHLDEYVYPVEYFRIIAKAPRKPDDPDHNPDA